MDITIAYIVRVVYTAILLYFLKRAIQWLIKYANLVRTVNKIHAPVRMIPFIGNAHQLKPGSGFFQQIKQVVNENKDQNLLRLWIGTQPIIVFFKAEYVEFLFNSHKHIDKSPEYNFLHQWLGTGLLTSTGEKWKQRRHLITPSFHFDILNDFLSVMNEQADIMVENLRNKIKSNDKFDICPFISNCALDIICETAMGQNVNAQKDNNSPYVLAVVKISELVFHRIKYPWYGLDFIFNNSKIGSDYYNCLKTIKDFTKKVIMERADDFDGSSIENTKRVAFLDTLLKCKKIDQKITYDDIQEEVDTFMFEGHDTTAAAASWACFLIGSHPEVQNKLHEELDRVFGNSNRHCTQDDLRELKYLDCVIKETLRMFPSVAFFARTITEDTKCENYLIPKGSTAIIFAYMIHRDEKYFPNPESFIPERFLNDNQTSRHPFSYVPFSAGRRNCIGQKFAQMEEKVMLSSILRKFKIKALQKRDELEEDFELILRPKTGIIIKLEPRE